MGRVYTLIRLGVAGALLACVSCVPRVTAPSRVDARAKEILREMGRALDGSQAFRLRAVGVMDEELETGQLTQISRESRISLRRPNGLFVETVGDDVKRTAWYNGSTLTLLDHNSNTCGSMKAPGTVEATLDAVVERYGLTLPVADLLFRNPYAVLIANVETGAYLGRQHVGDHSCHHLAFRQEAIDWQIWIDAGDTPVPRKLVITYTQEPGNPTYEVTMDEWDLNATHRDSLFEARPPADARRVTVGEMFASPEGDGS